MRFYGYNPERKEKGNLNLYIRFMFIGAVCGGLIILLGSGFRYAFNVILNYWVIILGVSIGLGVLYKVMNKNKNNITPQNTVNNYYGETQ